MPFPPSGNIQLTQTADPTPLFKTAIGDIVQKSGFIHILSLNETFYPKTEIPPATFYLRFHHGHPGFDPWQIATLYLKDSIDDPNATATIRKGPGADLDTGWWKTPRYYNSKRVSVSSSVLPNGGHQGPELNHNWYAEAQLYAEGVHYTFYWASDLHRRNVDRHHNDCILDLVLFT